MIKDLYEAAKLLPHSATSKAISAELIVNGPFAASDTADGSLLLLRAWRTSSYEALILKLANLHELQMCRVVRGILDTDASLALMRGTHEVIAIAAEDVSATRCGRTGHFECEAFPLMAGTLATIPRSGNVGVVLVQARRLVRAIRALHAANLVHMDVKPANVFLDVSGSWFLGDFGSMVGVGDRILSCTDMFLWDAYIATAPGPARFEYDWHMLVATICCHLAAPDFETLFTALAGGRRHVDEMKLEVFVSELRDIELRALLRELMACTI